MKTLQFVLPYFIAIICIGCATPPTVPGNAAANVRNFLNEVEPALRPGARLGCMVYIDFAVKTQDRATVTAAIQKISSIVAGTSITTSPGDLSKSIQAVLPSNVSQAKTLADAIAGGWGIALPYIKGDPSLLLKVTQDLAAGCMDATAQ